MEAVRVLVCGGRNYYDYQRLCAVLDAQHANEPITTLIDGGARGADYLAGQWADSRGVDRVTYWANWNGGINKRAAGPIRNSRMLLEGRPSLVIAFPGGSGTADMVSRAERKGVPVQFPSSGATW